MAVLIEDQEALLSFCTGNVPVILSAPHGGSTGIPGIKGKRQAFTVTTPGCGFNHYTDTRTKELTHHIVETMASLGVVPYAVISDIVRKDLDLNRAPAENVYAPEVSAAAVNRALQLHDAYYARLWHHIQTTQKVFEPDNVHKALLLELHGAGFDKGDLDLRDTLTIKVPTPDMDSPIYPSTHPPIYPSTTFTGMLFHR
jgi:hypothetical protein